MLFSCLEYTILFGPLQIKSVLQLKYTAQMLLWNFHLAIVVFTSRIAFENFIIISITISYNFYKVVLVL